MIKNRRVETITEGIIKEVKRLSKKHSQSYIASELNISQYSVWCIVNGKHDTTLPLQYDRINKQSNFIHQ